MRYTTYIIIFLFMLLRPAFSQTVETLSVSGLNGPNGFALDKTGVLYVANETGKEVVRIINDSIVEKVLDADSPCGLDFDGNGNLYIINFFSGIVLRKTNNSIDTFARGLDKPADIKWDGKASLYVSQYEKGSIIKINQDGELVEFATKLKNPFGLSFDDVGNLYVASNATGEIDKVSPAGTVSFFAQIPGAASYIAMNRKTGKLYVPCFSCHKIYAITKEGEVGLLTGDGPAGHKDGSLGNAQFEGPNSIVVSPGGLYISEFTSNRIRKITGLEK